MAYVKKADRPTYEQARNVSELKEVMTEQELQYVAKLEVAWKKVAIPSIPRRTYMGHFETWYELGVSNKVQYPRLITNLVRIATSKTLDPDEQYEAVVLIATHGATQLFGGLLE